jgi:hypothetical protein
MEKAQYVSCSDHQYPGQKSPFAAPANTLHIGLQGPANLVAHVLGNGPPTTGGGADAVEHRILAERIRSFPRPLYPLVFFRTPSRETTSALTGSGTVDKGVNAG